MSKEFIVEELKKQPEESIAGLPCRSCGSAEIHKKIEGKWVCKKCGHHWDASDL